MQFILKLFYARRVFHAVQQRIQFYVRVVNESTLQLLLQGECQVSETGSGMAMPLIIC
jgi:hypothetical protein